MIPSKKRLIPTRIPTNQSVCNGLPIAIVKIIPRSRDSIALSSAIHHFEAGRKRTARIRFDTESTKK